MGASDLHLTAGSRPFCRLHGELHFFDEPPITFEMAERMVMGFLDDEQREIFTEHRDLDLSWEHPHLSRFRANALMQFRGPSIILRIIPSVVPTLQQLGMPDSLEALTEWSQGLVLVTGPAGCGKSTTAAALVNCVNENRMDHVITVEDPIEYLHPSKSCNVTQRQVHPHTESFSAALKAALREDPDVIMIGEMRDLETISLAMTAAETGHLVIGTLHTKSAARTIDRIVDVFPADQQAQVRTMLAGSLRGIITQQLVRKNDRSGRVASLETLYVTTAVANLIRDSKTYQLPSVMQTGRKVGQKLMDESLDELVQSGTINKEEAIKVAEDPRRFK
ncbi:MAG: PilT/PilU family type 4a pilus ATPase [Phycisphaera sp.]|nr:PilT/PilU family type 4a pilus ATPase [Phycisphaera sp.]